MTCTQCHKREAFSDRRRTILSRDVGTEIPGARCFQCIVDNPAYHHAIISWTAT
jgi:hypothetical protein